MSTGTGIQWTDATWNPVVGCTRVSAGCDHCYAVKMSHRLEGMGQSKYAGLTVLNKRGERHFGGVVRCDESALEVPLRWRKPRRVFVNSMSDLFHEDVPPGFIRRVFAVMEDCPQHVFQILTKRPERALELAPELPWPPQVWMGTSVESAGYVHRVRTLRRIPARTRFLSCEPLLGPLPRLPLEGIHWVIVGGESGPGARPFAVEWGFEIIDQCKEAGVPLFFKQRGSNPVFIARSMASMFDNSGEQILQEDKYQFIPIRQKDPKGGDPSEWPEDLRVRQFPDTTPGA
jgi:protein gp37